MSHEVPAGLVDDTAAPTPGAASAPRASHAAMPVWRPHPTHRAATSHLRRPGWHRALARLCHWASDTLRRGGHSAPPIPALPMALPMYVASQERLRRAP